eukprot:Nk52_evm48s1569 gene=Nk52_evmTU48s1569
MMASLSLPGSRCFRASSSSPRPHVHVPRPNPFPFCDNVSKYEKLDKIGQGTFGEVFKAKNRDTGEIVALKKVLMENEKEGFPITAIREIKILKQLNHKNIVRLIEICHTPASELNKNKGSIYMVFEFMDHDLTGLLDRPGVKFSEAQIKAYAKQLCEGLYHMHIQKAIHRDIKGSNMLINNKGELKIADFGLARAFNVNPDRDYTNRVVTLWYRPPELLLGTNHYGASVDMWGVGCILAELYTKKPLFPGGEEMEQIRLICKLCGTPNEQNWPGVSKLKNFDMLKNFHMKPRLREFLKSKNVPANAIDLIEKLLSLDPSKRPGAAECCDDDYFWTNPMPLEIGNFPKYPSSHELAARNRNKEAHAKQQIQSLNRQQPDNIRGGAHYNRGGGYNSNRPHSHHNHNNRHNNRDDRYNSGSGGGHQNRRNYHQNNNRDYNYHDRDGGGGGGGGGRQWGSGGGRHHPYSRNDGYHGGHAKGGGHNAHYKGGNNNNSNNSKPQ